MDFIFKFIYGNIIIPFGDAMDKNPLRKSLDDVDTVLKINNPQILNLIAKVGTNHGLSSNWLNDQAASVDAPKGLTQRAKKLLQIGRT